MSKSQMLNMRYPKELLERIDKCKEEKGFTTRTQTIMHLIQIGLEKG
jgi:metal-responsive CopG/Arc/MetJ family transcriptional regulator